nr:CRISPR-associated endonuclease Cas1 [Nitrosomonas nitrosa]
MTSLYVDRRGVELEVDGEALVFRENGLRTGTVPMAPLSRVFLRGDIRLQTSVLGKLGERGIGVIVLSGRKAEPTMLLARPHNDAASRVAQYQLSRDTAFCLAFSRNLVFEKISSQRDYALTLREQVLEHRYELTLVLRTLDQILLRIMQIPTIAALRGAEGAASAAHFRGIAAIAVPRLNFSQRNRRPPRDPLNAVLSLSYTLLHTEAVLALYGAGLDPFIGFYHQLDFGRESLACDLVEPLRVEVDSFALQLFRKEIIRPEAFSTSENGCFMNKNARAAFYGEWEKLAERLRKMLADQITKLMDQLTISPSTFKDKHETD